MKKAAEQGFDKVQIACARKCGAILGYVRPESKAQAQAALKQDRLCPACATPVQPAAEAATPPDAARRRLLRRRKQ